MTRRNLCHRTLSRALLAATALAGAAVMFASEAEAASATSNADAELVAAIGITNAAGLNFGKFANNGAGGTVVVSTAGTVSTTGDVVAIASSGALAASFDVTGEANTSYTISLPASATVTDASANSMTVDTFDDSGSGTGTLDGTGNDSFTVGATLTVGGTQVAGAYSGTFDVTVEYQ